MGTCKRPRTREFAPKNSGSLKKPERLNIRCTTEECGRAMNAVQVSYEILAARGTDFERTITEAFHRCIIPVFEKVVRAYRHGSAAERASASVYLEEFIRPEDYLKNRHQSFQPQFKFSV